MCFLISDKVVLVLCLNALMSNWSSKVIVLGIGSEHNQSQQGRFICHFAGIWHCYWEYDNHKQASATISDIGFTTNFKAYLQVQETWLAFCESDENALQCI